MKRMIWMGCYLYLLIGLAHVILGAILPELLAHYGRDYKDGGILISLQFSGFLLGVLIAPSCIHWLGRKKLLIMALVFLFIGQIIYSILPSWYWMLTAAPIAGVGFGMVETGIGALIIEFVKEKKAVAMSKLEVFFGIGGLIMPLISGFLILQGAWHLSFTVIAVYSLILAIFWITLSFGEIDHLLAKSNGTVSLNTEKSSYLRKSLPILYFMVAFFMLYVGVEISIVNFLPSIMIENIGMSKAVAAMSVTFFWSTMIVGRIFAGIIAERIQYFRFLLYSSFGSLLFLALFSFSSLAWISFALILMLGLFMSGIFAIALVFANHVLPGMTARTTSVLVAAGGIGGALIPLLTGWSMDVFPVEITQLLLVGLMLLMALVMLSAVRYSRV